MFGRFGPQARRVINLAEDHARALWRPAVGPEHLLLALLAVDDSGAFVRVGLRFDDLRTLLLDSPTGDPPPEAVTRQARHLPLRLREVFRAAFRHAASLGHPEVAPLHLALALVDDPPGEITAALRRLGIDAVAVRASVLAEITGDTSAVENVVELRRREPVGVATPDGIPAQERAIP